MLYLLIIVSKHEAEGILAVGDRQEKRLQRRTGLEARARAEFGASPVVRPRRGLLLELVQQASERVDAIAGKAAAGADIRIGGAVITVQVVLVLAVEHIVYAGC